MEKPHIFNINHVIQQHTYIIHFVQPANDVHSIAWPQGSFYIKWEHLSLSHVICTQVNERD